ncbi:thioredoxin reductase [Actinotalea ferrariae CF5-4]|uniref:acylphosphatase n=1 Tax=Actinotalea ferrariae CF5-4 TaxID=948458 RepID=A0A021VS62_9CELL|nr:FAD-dependent oxidoreductase [Actinotalea ferrariae]EYR64006.1 thioredoxin reductase [Actinotalea ferrariae CF5-4]
MDPSQLTATVLVSGRVQGVGFRWWTRRRLEELALHGEAQNMADGTVEIRVSGAARDVDRLLTVLRGGGTPGRVTEVRLVTASRPETAPGSDARPDADRVHDVVVVGGGPAGLSAALLLGRSRRDVVVVDDGRPRNAAADHVHGFLGNEGIPPRDLVARGRAEVERYGVRLQEGTVTAVERGETDAEGPAAPLAVTLADGSTLRSRRVLVTTGMRDDLPQVAGMTERWGRDVLHCPYCHGWEHRDQRLVVIATHAAEVDKALTVRQWSSAVTLLLHRYTGDPLDDVARARLAATGVEVVEGTADALLVRDDRLVGIRFDDGRALPCDAVVVQPRLVARDDLLLGTGVSLEAGPFGEHVRTDENGATGVPGVWAAGNVAVPQAQVVTAAADGARAAVAIDHDLVLEDADRAVATGGAVTPYAADTRR